jgi:predicted nucleic acid-binding protein
VARLTALIDSNVFFSMAITDLMLETARAGAFRACWSQHIHAEWTRNLLEKNPDLEKSKIDRRRKAMDLAIPDALVEGYEHLIDGLTLINAKDRHVLAAAIAGGADVIVTKNLRDFPDDVLGKFGIEAQHPDTFLIHQRGLNEQGFLECVRRCRARLMNPPKSADEYLEGLQRADLVVLAAELAKVKSLL